MAGPDDHDDIDGRVDHHGSAPGDVTRDEATATPTAGPRRRGPVVAGALGLAALAALLGTGMASEDPAPPETTVAEVRAPLPTGSEVAGRDGAESSAVRLATALDAVAGDEGEPCAEDDLVVRWSDPQTEPEHGAWVEPLGAPEDGDDSANGIVACRGSDLEVAGFQADYRDGRWSVAFVPDLAHDEHELAASQPTTGDRQDEARRANHDADRSEPHDHAEAPDGDHEDGEDLLDPTLAPDGEPVLPGTGDDPDVLGDDSPWVGLWDDVAPDVEPLASYEPQQICSPSPKPGAVGFRNLVLRAYPDTRDSGISRACDQGGRSEHKEGRAWDWGVHVDDPEERQAAAEVIGWLLATDEHGNEHAMARRLGVMYVIYNGHIWSAYAAERGWQPYVGRSDHTDHVHVSFDVAGGLGQTSFWQVPGLEQLADSRFGPAAILPEYGGGIGFVPSPSDEDAAAPAEEASGSPTTATPAPSAPRPGAGGGGGTPAQPAPAPAPPTPPPPPPTTLPPTTVPRPPVLGPIDDLLGPILCGLLPCPPP